MERTFKDNVKSISYRICTNYPFLKPVVIGTVFIILCVYNFVGCLKNNEKRLVTVFIAAIFFFINTSFSGIDNNDAEVYIINSESDADLSTESTDSYYAIAENYLIESVSSDIIDTEYVNSKETSINDSKIELFDDDEIVSTKLLSDEIGKSLENVDVSDAFTVEDFMNKYNENISVSSTEPLSGFDKDAWYLILVNKTHPVPDDYEMELATIKGSMQCDARVLDILLNMLNGAQKEGVNLIVCSPYRDYELQKALFNKKVNLYVSNGYSYLDAYKLASQKVIVPGASEHQLGIAFDIVTDYHSVLDYEFGDTAAGKWLKSNCAKYGFILRYPRGKESITGIEYEPWHFRYVGVDAATYIMENDITLEEFIEGL